MTWKLICSLVNVNYLFGVFSKKLYEARKKKKKKIFRSFSFWNVLEKLMSLLPSTLLLLSVAVIDKENFLLHSEQHDDDGEEGEKQEILNFFFFNKTSTDSANVVISRRAWISIQITDFWFLLVLTIQINRWMKIQLWFMHFCTQCAIQFELPSTWNLYWLCSNNFRSST